MKQQAQHNFSIIIADYIRLGRMANVQQFTEAAHESRPQLAHNQNNI